MKNEKMLIKNNMKMHHKLRGCHLPRKYYCDNRDKILRDDKIVSNLGNYFAILV